MILEGEQLQVVEEIPATNDRVIEQVAARYASHGHFPFSSDLRSLAPSQCSRSALEDGTGTIVLIPERAVSQAEMRKVNLAQKATLKRAASRELSEGRPRKFHVIGD